MKDKVLIILILALALALFVETAYIIQLQCDQKKNEVALRRENFYPANPFKEIENFQNEINQLFNGAFNLSEAFLDPDVKIEETSTHYLLSVPLPDGDKTGKDKIKVEIEGDSLVISAKSNEKINRNGFYKQSFNSFRKVIPLPGEVKVSEVTTEYKDGELIVKLPKVAKTAPSAKANIKIEI